MLSNIVKTEISIYTKLKATVETIAGTYTQTVVCICSIYVIIRDYRSYVWTSTQSPVITQVEVTHYRNLKVNRTPSKVFSPLSSLTSQEYIWLDTDELIDTDLITCTDLPMESCITFYISNITST